MDEDEAAVLRVVVVKRVADPPDIARATGLTLTDVRRILVALRRRGLVTLDTGEAVPTRAVEAALSGAVDPAIAARDDPDVRPLAAGFAAVDARLEDAMAAWQQLHVDARTATDAEPDAAYDRDLFDSLHASNLYATIHANLDIIAAVLGAVEDVTPLLDALETHHPRFGDYRARLAAAYAGVGYDDLEAMDFIPPTWAELRDDLARTLG